MLRKPPGVMGKNGGGKELARVLVLTGLCAAACGRTNLFDDSECTPGKARICSASGALGAQECTAAGYWGHCEEASSDGSGARTGSSGSSGSVGSVGAGGSGATAGIPSTGGAPVAGVGGTGEGGFGEGGFGEGGFGEGGEGAVSPTVEFGRTIGPKGNIEIRDLAAERSGTFAIAASTYNTDVDFGAPTTPLVNQGEEDAIIAEFGSDGAPLRASLSGAAADQVATSVAYDSNGALISTETHSWGSTPGVLVRRTDPFGTLEWSKFFQGLATAEEVAVDAERSVILTGVFAGPVDFGGGALPSSSSTNTYVVKLDQDGDWVWGREFMGYHSFPTGIATDSEGNVIVVGTCAYYVDFGAGVVTCVSSSDLFVVKFSSTGELLFAHTYAGNNYQDVRGVAVLSDDSFAIAGRFTGDLDLGLGPIHGSGAILVSKFSAEGVTSWAQAIDSTKGEANAFDVAVDPSDNIVLAGSFQGTLQVPTPLQATGIDAFVVGLGPDGKFDWAQSFGGPGAQDALAVDTDAQGRVFVGGRFSNSIDFGDGPVSASGSLMDLFVAKIVP